MYIDVSDVIQANEHTKYPNCGLPVNFLIFLLMSFCFTITKESQAPFKNINQYILNLSFYFLLHDCDVSEIGWEMNGEIWQDVLHRIQ